MSETRDALAPGWTWAAIADLADINPKTEADDTLPCGFAPMQSLGTRYRGVLQFQPRPWGEVKRAYTHFKDDDVLLAKVTPCFENGKAGVATGLPNGIGAGSSEFLVLRQSGAADSRYLLGWLSTEDFRRRATVAMTGSVGLKRVPKSFVQEEMLPVAPLAEQQRIANKLDTVLTRVDSCRDRLARVAPLLKRFRQSVLAAATSGRLTEDWRSTDESDWRPTRVEELCALISDGPFGSHLKSDDYVAGGVRIVRLENVGHLFFDQSKETYISAEKYATLFRHTLMAGDLLFSSFVDEEVRVCAFPAGLGTPAINKADCFCLRVDPASCIPRFLELRLACKTTYAVLKANVHGATRPRINLRHIREFVINMPSPEEQTEIVRRVETLFAFADRLEARLAQAHTAVERLTPALLAKAFRGELVPQDPADEPATELLKRLAKQRSPDTPTRGRQPSTASR